MALDARKRQKKAEQRKKKERAKRTAHASKKVQSWKERLQRAAYTPVLHCMTFGEDGMHEVLLSREMSNGMVAYELYLVDTWCLGVKDAFFGIVPIGDYQERVYESFCRQESVRSIAPASARKFVEGAVDYAKRLGLSPHKDYATACALFGDIDAATSSEVFEYGKDGKPFFYAGPNDPEWRCNAIVKTLTESCGEGNFHFTIPLAPDDFGAIGLSRETWETLVDDDEWDDDDDEDHGDEDDIDDEVHAGNTVIDVKSRDA